MARKESRKLPIKTADDLNRLKCIATGVQPGIATSEAIATKASTHFCTKQVLTSEPESTLDSGLSIAMGQSENKSTADRLVGSTYNSSAPSVDHQLDRMRQLSVEFGKAPNADFFSL